MLLPLHLPRRHRRPLLFPPGLLALAWLLWLGCVALPRVAGSIPSLITTIAPLPLQLGLYTNRATPAFASARVDYTSFTTSSATIWDGYFFSQQLNLLPPNSVAGQPLKGVKLQFSFIPQPHELDGIICQLARQPDLHFWLDTRMRTTSIYVYRQPQECRGLMPIAIDFPTPSYIRAAQTQASLSSLSSFFQPDWRNSTLLLLLMALLSAVRLGWRWRAE